MTPTEMTAWMTAGKGAVDLMRSAWQLMPKGERKDQIEEKVTQVETALRASDAALAQALGYKLCRCTFPPQIMLWRQSEGTNICELCGSKDPTPISDKVLDMARRGPNHYF
ncbi:MAG: hypothetical protein EPN75_03320 [Beijerinckiaceae bacterium]|nr:MAG: hypothetical protein EPN75_03320 [Beijerinckiaceae bacterium]